VERTPGFSKSEINRIGKSLLKLNRTVLGLFVAWSILATPAVAGKHTKDSLFALPVLQGHYNRP
jgi:hypothetical protein